MFDCFCFLYIAKINGDENSVDRQVESARNFSGNVMRKKYTEHTVERETELEKPLIDRENFRDILYHCKLEYRSVLIMDIALVNGMTFEEFGGLGTAALVTRSTHDVGTVSWVASMVSGSIITIPVLFLGGVGADALHFVQGKMTQKFDIALRAFHGGEGQTQNFEAQTIHQRHKIVQHHLVDFRVTDNTLLTHILLAGLKLGLDQTQYLTGGL